MRLMGRLIAIIVVVVGLFVVPRLFDSGYSTFAEQNMPLIKATVEKAFEQADPACIRGDGYIVSRGAANPGPFAGSNAPETRRHCARCEEFRAAGLLTKASTAESDTQSARASTSQYALTPLGREVYSEEIRSSATDPATRSLDWRFCFGKTRLQSIDKAGKPFWLGGNRYVRITFTLYVENPHAILFESTGKVLGLATPTKKSPAVLAPMETTVEFFPNGEADLRSDVQ